MKVAIITGGNKGIGFETARKIGAKGIQTILACRNENLGIEAAETLKKEGIDAKFYQLDITDNDSIQRFAQSIATDYSAIDILVNNAAIAFKGSDPTPFKDQARPTMVPNYFGTLNVTLALLPLLRKAKEPRIVNVASEAGHLRIIKSEAIQNQFRNAASVEEISNLITSFVNDVESGNHEAKGWPNSNYGMSKIGVIALNNLLARQEGSRMRINACCPGWCATDMSSHKGPKSAEDGARTPAWLALDIPADGPTGAFFAEQKEIEW